MLNRFKSKNKFVISHVVGAMAAVGARLANRDSILVRPYLVLSRATTNTFRKDYVAAICNIDRASEAQFVKVAPATKGLCYPPKNFQCAHQIAPRPTTLPEIKIVTLKNQLVEICSSFPFDPKFQRIYVDGAFTQSPSYASYASGHLLAHGRRRAIVRTRVAPGVIEEGIFLGGNGSFNYYHWLIEIATKLQVLSWLPERMKEVPLLINKRVLEVDSYRDILKALTPDRKFICLEQGNSYFVKRLTYIEPFVSVPFNLLGGKKFMAEHCWTRPEAVHYLRSAVLSALDQVAGEQWPQRIFLARSNRRPYNQDELIAIAMKRGFHVLYAEQYSFLKQAGFFANARVVIGPAGAGFSNLVFANSCCKVLCWMAAELGDYAIFSNIAGIRGIDMGHLLYSAAIRSAHEWYDHSYQISADVFKKALDWVLT